MSTPPRKTSPKLPPPAPKVEPSAPTPEQLPLTSMVGKPATFDRPDGTVYHGIIVSVWGVKQGTPGITIAYASPDADDLNQFGRNIRYEFRNVGPAQMNPAETSPDIANAAMVQESNEPAA